MTVNTTSSTVTGGAPMPGAAAPSASVPSDLTPTNLTVSNLTVSTEAVMQFAHRLEHMAHDIDVWVVRARVIAMHVEPAHRHSLEVVSDACARVADYIRADAVSAQTAADSYDANESWWAGMPGLAVTVLAGAAAFLAPSRITVAAFRRSVTGVSSLIAGAAGIARAANLTSGAIPSALSVRPVARADCLPPGSFNAAVARIPAAESHRPQVRIEKTPTAAFVYIGGTVTGSIARGPEPWDMTSNIAAMTGQVSDSERGVRAALSAAGVTNADRIVVVGHSQGGLVAQRLAADPQLRVSDVVLVGSPQAPGSVAPGVHVVALENRNDPIPALGGMAPEGRADVTVSRTPLIPPGEPLAAHHVSAYRDLANEADASHNPALINVRREIFGTENTSCNASEWRVDRVR